MTGYAYVWEFYVQPEKNQQFERVYGPEGEWVRLFRQAAGYVGTLLLRDRSMCVRYLTVDRWSDSESYENFYAAFAAEYDALDKACEGLTIRETSLGSFTE